MSDIFIFILGIMKKDIDELLVELKDAITEKYGEKFRKLHLLNYQGDWNGLISCYDEMGEREPHYFGIKNDSVIMDEDKIHLNKV